MEPYKHVGSDHVAPLLWNPQAELWNPQSDNHLPWQGYGHPVEQVHVAQPPIPMTQDGVEESKWDLGWQAMATMISFYVLALGVALVHMGMFIHLDGRPTNSKDAPSQTYVAAASTFLVNLFGTTLGISVGAAFTQYMWRQFRTTPMTVAAVETIYSVRGTPLFLLKGSVWLVAPVLYSMALVILLLAIARIFPPGAITVVPRNLERFGTYTVPTFKADFVGDTSRQDAQALATGLFGVQTSQWVYKSMNPAVRRLAHATLTLGEVVSSQSPCGANCSYAVTFQGPHFSCSNTSEIITQDFANRDTEGALTYLYYSAGLSVPYRENIPYLRAKDPDDEENIQFRSFFMNESSPIGLIDRDEQGRLVTKWNSLECQPAFVTYDLNVTFLNGVRTLQTTRRDDVRPLLDIYSINVTPPKDDGGPQDWSDKQLDNMKFTNLYALIDSVQEALTGGHLMYAGFKDTSNTVESTKLSNGTTVRYRPSLKAFWKTYRPKLSPVNGTIVVTTYFNKNRDSLDPLADPDLAMSADLLNDAVANVTLSVLFSLPNWKTRREVVDRTSLNYYSFSNPRNLFLPYGISLLVTLPFLILGIIALRRNGVPAMDGSFLQILMTTAASKRLNMQAAQGCLGGETNVPKNLEKQRIIFGEVIRSDSDYATVGFQDAVVRRAGFGFEDEVAPLRERGRYGIGPE